MFPNKEDLIRWKIKNIISFYKLKDGKKYYYETNLSFSDDPIKLKVIFRNCESPYLVIYEGHNGEPRDSILLLKLIVEANQLIYLREIKDA